MKQPLGTPQRRSSRKQKKKPAQSLIKVPPPNTPQTEYVWKTFSEDKLGSWLSENFCFPATPYKSFYTYYDKYVQIERPLLEKHCFKCKEKVSLKSAIVCGSSKCNKVYHRQCVTDPDMDLCPLHYCITCKSKAKHGQFCYMCPETTCSKCLGKEYGKKQMSLCSTCASSCAEGDLETIRLACLYKSPSFVKN